MLMRTINAICQQDPILGTASVDKGGALNVLGAERDLRLKIYCLATISCCKLFQLMVVLGIFFPKQSIDSSFCWIYSVTLSRFLRGLAITIFVVLKLGFWVCK